MAPVFLTETSYNLSESILPLESGFWCLSGGGVKFRLQFFTILLIFVLFDIEVVLLSPVIFLSANGFFTFLSVLIFIFFTLLLEWWWGKLT